MKISTLIITVILFASQWNPIATQTNLVTPSDADLIVVLRGSNLLDKVSLDDMKDMPFMADFFNELSGMVGQTEAEIDELGIDLNSKAQYFLKYQEDGSMLMGASFNVDNPEAYKTNFLTDGEMKEELGVTYTISDGYTRALMGNKGLVTYSVLPRNTGNPYRGYEETYIYDDSEVEEIEVLEYEDIEEEVILEEMPDTPVEQEADERIVLELSPDSEELEEEAYEIIEAEPAYEEEEPYDYQAEYEAKKALENEKIAVISKAYAIELLTSKKAPASFTSEEIDEKADFSVLVKNYGTLVTNMMASPSYYRSSMEVQMEEWTRGLYQGFEWFSMNGYYEKDQFRVKMNSKISGSLSSWYSKMLDKEFNPKMLNYIPFDDHLTYATGTYNTTELLNGYYAYTKELMSSFPEELERDFEIREAASIAIDFVELFMDEAAIGNLFQGDFYAGITDINSYEIEYTTYEYDDDWNYSEITKTKEEVRPDFLMMFSSGDVKNVNNIFKLISIASQGEFNLQENGSYKLNAGKSVPLDIYALQKDGIVFVCSSQYLYDFIQKGGAKPSAEQKALITSNSSVFKINTSKIAGKVPMNELPGEAQKAFEYLETNAGDVQLTSGKMKNDMISSELQLKVKGKHKNSLAYFLNVIDAMYEIEKENSTYRN